MRTTERAAMEKMPIRLKQPRMCWLIVVTSTFIGLGYYAMFLRHGTTSSDNGVEQQQEQQMEQQDVLQQPLLPWSIEFVPKSLEFIPRPPSRFADCDDLFVGTPVDHFNMSVEYWSLYGQFQTAISKIHPQEGYSWTKLKQALALHYLAGRPGVRTVCETGFNVGHSSFSFLTANPNTIVHSFDLGQYGYSKEMGKYMAERFPGRFFIHFGDSTKTVPEFIRSNPAFRCDLIFVDGGHTYQVAKADLENFVSIGNRTNVDNAIIFDDYPSLLPMGNDIGRAWENLIRSSGVTELMRCMFTNLKSSPPSKAMGEYRQGFVIGTLNSL